MTANVKIKTTDNKIKQRKCQYDFDKQLKKNFIIRKYW